MKLLVISDIHGNYEALEAIASTVRYDEVLCLGDLVDFGPDPKECVEWVRRSTRYIVRGNHDHALANNVACRCSSEKLERLAEATRSYSHSMLDVAEINFLGSLPLKLAVSIGGRSLYAVHGGPRDPLYQSIEKGSDKALAAELAGIDAEFILFGHTHRPLVNSTALNGRTVVNPGSVGQPRDGDNRASAALIDLDSGVARILRIKYDIDIVCRKMAHAGFPGELIDILRCGR
ncbi:MAG: metallophosphoesterase family protein [Candidatus Micrarchaeia archaeon]